MWLLGSQQCKPLHMHTLGAGEEININEQSSTDKRYGTGSCYDRSSTATNFVLAADEDLRGRNVLQLTPLSLLRELLRIPQKQAVMKVVS